MKHFDLVIIGGGPGGYVAAIKAAQLGMKVACVEKRGTLGGTCLNVGCIPSKALLHASHKYHEVKEGMADDGIEIGSVKLSVEKMMASKNAKVAGLTKGIEGLFAKNKVTYIKGMASFAADKKLTVQLNDGGQEELQATNIIIATGSEVSALSGVVVDEQKIVTSTGALELSAVPKHLVVIGGGYIGLEMGSVWQRLGAKVTVIEYADRIVASMDNEISSGFQKILVKQGFEFMLSTKVLKAEVNGKIVKVQTESVDGKTQTTLEADVVLLAAGRKPHTSGLGLEKIGVELDKGGRIPVDGHYQTAVQGVYAIGDVIVGPMLAHKAEEEGVAVVELLAGQKPHVNYDTIPGVIYTHPEVATVGKTEQQLKAEGVAYRVGKFPMLANSRARTSGETDGFVKIIACAQTDTILGAHIIAPGAGDLIGELVLAMEFKAASEDVARICHPHPSVSEAIKEACLATFAKPIHL